MQRDTPEPSGPTEPPELWIHLLLFVEEHGPVLVPRVAEAAPALRRAEVLDTLVVLADARLVHLRTARGVAIRRGWRSTATRMAAPAGVDPTTWDAFVRLIPPPPGERR